MVEVLWCLWFTSHVLNSDIIAQKQDICGYVSIKLYSQTWKFEFPIIFMYHEAVFFSFLLQLLKNVKDILCSQVPQNQAKVLFGLGP